MRGRHRGAQPGEVRISQDPVHVRRRRAVLGGVLALLLAVVTGAGVWLTGAWRSGDDTTVASVGDISGGTGDGALADGAGPDGAATTSEGAEAASVTAEQTPEPDPVWQKEPVPNELPSDTTAMEPLDYLTGGMTPKSVMASNHGLAIANNMMYSHTSTVFDTTTREQVAVLDDEIDLAEFGVEGHPGISQGSPVEAVWTADGRYAYVSQYTMYGQNFGIQGFDACTRDSGVGPSFLYRFDAEEMAWDQVIKVGAVPKYLEITPDQTTILVSNWCDATISVVDVEKAEETKVIDVNESPRGIAIMPDSNTAYVVAMYAQSLFKVDIDAGTSELVMNTTLRPRHLNLTEDGSTLYMTVSSANTIYKIDTSTDEIVDEVSPGLEPRSVTLSPDETALYVVNYNEATVSKVRTSDMEVIDKVDVDADPIGIDYDPVTNTVWVACYNGSIYVFDDQSTPL
ncbi:YncE family protein [Ornithinimicrobium avium]|uniref:YncE family protein n=2 Tax=Ornithinimicrobium avium TaxID=2283195 RepID=A0A345NT57_9MICO|nr:YncE family protein [Ornithinimicrobium avium]